jgi:hypothetical protein
MLRKINRILNLYLCQGADWQCIVEAADQESAATLAIEKVMFNKDQSFGLSSVVVVKKLSNDLLHENENFENVCFYTPIMLANAGFHIEAKNLHAILDKQGEELDNGF